MLVAGGEAPHSGARRVVPREHVTLVPYGAGVFVFLGRAPPEGARQGAPSVSFTIRAATEDDLPEMLRLWREMMGFHAARDPRFRPKPSPEGEKAWSHYLREEIWASDTW